MNNTITRLKDEELLQIVGGDGTNNGNSVVVDIVGTPARLKKIFGSEGMIDYVTQLAIELSQQYQNVVIKVVELPPKPTFKPKVFWF